MKAIILSLVQYKEKNAIVQAISQDKSFSFLAKGILDPKNKNAVINNPLSIIELELSERENLKYPLLKNATILISPLQMMDKLEKLATIQLIDEIILKCLSEEERTKIFNQTIDAIENLKKNRDYLTNILFFIAEILKLTGYGFEVDHCLFCGSKKEIVGFSFNDGGFVCQNCDEGQFKNEFTKDELFFIRLLFKTIKLDNVLDNTLDETSKLKLLRRFVQFIKDNIGVSLKSSELILR